MNASQNLIDTQVESETVHFRLSEFFTDFVSSHGDKRRYCRNFSDCISKEGAKPSSFDRHKHALFLSLGLEDLNKRYIVFQDKTR